MRTLFPPLSDPARIVTAAQMRALELAAATPLKDGAGVCSFFQMMERAGKAVASVVEQLFPRGPVLVLCGPGNNGGDGFIAAEALRQSGWPVHVVAMGERVACSVEARAARAAWQGETLSMLPGDLEQGTIVIDALFGTGLTRPLSGEAQAMVQAVGAQRDRLRAVLAVDLPSGVATDTGQVLGDALRADVTVTFSSKKPSHLLLPAGLLCGSVLVAPLGIEGAACDEAPPYLAETSRDFVASALPRLSPAGHKYDRGHLAVFGGGEMTGAARLAIRASQRMGAGLVSAVVPAKAYDLYASALESVIVHKAEEEAWPQLLASPSVTTLLIGPGLGRDPSARDLVLQALASKKPCVLDADALSLFADRPDDLLCRTHEHCVLTPHEGEFLRVFGKGGGDKISRALAAASQASCVVLLKGADTVIASPEGPLGGSVWINRNAPPWLATAGAGDVLAGMIAGLLAQKMDPLTAAAVAAWLHGAAAARFGQGLIAEDLVETLPAILQAVNGASR